MQRIIFTGFEAKSDRKMVAFLREVQSIRNSVAPLASSCECFTQPMLKNHSVIRHYAAR